MLAGRAWWGVVMLTILRDCRDFPRATTNSFELFAMAARMDSSRAGGSGIGGCEARAHPAAGDAGVSRVLRLSRRHADQRGVRCLSDGASVAGRRKFPDGGRCCRASLRAENWTGVVVARYVARRRILYDAVSVVCRKVSRRRVGRAWMTFLPQKALACLTRTQDDAKL